MNPTSPALEAKRLTKHFRHVTALDSLDLEVMPGEVFALLGSNGSGKSTTFRLLLNIYRPSSGEAALLGRPTTSLNGSDFDKVGYISEGQKMPKWMRVDQFLEFCSGFYSEWDAELCERLVERFGLPPKQRIKFLSRGQCMKVSLASTLPARPRLLLLDEPFSGLDVETRAGLSELLKSLALDSGLAIVLTTHDVEEVEPVATRLGVLNRGRLVVNEPLADYLGRHRFLHLTGSSVGELPGEIGSRLKPVRVGEAAAFTDSFDGDLEVALRSGLPPGVEASFAPMTLRQIIAAHALPLG